ncbi:STAS domain-containing protein [Actinoallomurus sp. NPDC052308]|uniref:STAS domain-containing protein n=1 Tax=Actinoallomurus sp. NPDC052308 TaxID=3155530 RepID=UPI003434FFE7
MTITDRPQAGWIVMHLTGELYYGTVELFWDHLQALLASGLRRIALELSALTFCDSSGMACFIRAHRAIRPAGGQLILLRPTVYLQRRLTIAGLDAFVPSVQELSGPEGPTEPEALAGPGVPA